MIIRHCSKLDLVVKNISYAEHLIRVVDIDLAKGSCGLPYTEQGLIWVECRNCHRAGGGLCVYADYSSFYRGKIDTFENVHMAIYLIGTFIGSLVFYGYLIARYVISPVVLLAFLVYLYASRKINADISASDTRCKAQDQQSN
ncbi:hypothetical protein QQ045_019025 [Rhodiola kirilowii]